jgi:hypothetical protein
LWRPTSWLLSNSLGATRFNVCLNRCFVVATVYKRVVFVAIKKCCLLMSAQPIDDGFHYKLAIIVQKRVMTT